MDLARWRARRVAFGPVADVYDRVRPGYPLDALRWLLADLPPAPLRVVDLGAGTGILTRQLVGLGHQVIAVEPDAGMRAQLVARTPGVRCLDGSAEAIPLDDASVDAVLAGQAYHWFDIERAHPEIARVLRPGGVFGPLWNERDETAAWVAELTRILADTDAEHSRGQRARDVAPDRFGPWFGTTELAIFTHSVRHTAGSLVDLVRSRSYYQTATGPQRAELDAKVADLAAHHPDLAGRPAFDMPYLTRAYRTHS